MLCTEVSFFCVHTVSVRCHPFEKSGHPVLFIELIRLDLRADRLMVYVVDTVESVMQPSITIREDIL